MKKIILPPEMGGGQMFGMFSYGVYEKQIDHSRKIYGLFDLFGDIGGLMEVILIFASNLVSSFSEHQFFLKALQKLYLA
jgi:hypothetical protein